MKSWREEGGTDLSWTISRFACACVGVTLARIEGLKKKNNKKIGLRRGDLAVSRHPTIFRASSAY